MVPEQAAGWQGGRTVMGWVDKVRGGRLAGAESVRLQILVEDE